MFNEFLTLKSWVNPLGKMQFGDFENLTLSYSRKASFLFRTLLKIISSIILNNNKKRHNRAF